MGVNEQEVYTEAFIFCRRRWPKAEPFPYTYNIIYSVYIIYIYNIYVYGRGCDNRYDWVRSRSKRDALIESAVPGLRAPN